MKNEIKKERKKMGQKKNDLETDFSIV